MYCPEQSTPTSRAWSAPQRALPEPKAAQAHRLVVASSQLAFASQIGAVLPGLRDKQSKQELQKELLYSGYAQTATLAFRSRNTHSA